MERTEKAYNFYKGIEPDIALTNFHPPEGGFVWSSHTWSELKFDLPLPAKFSGVLTPDFMLDITLDIHAFKSPPDLNGQNVYIYVNGRRHASRYITHKITVLLELPSVYLKKHENVITIDAPDAARPFDHGLSDTRLLGIQLFLVKLATR